MFINSERVEVSEGDDYETDHVVQDRRADAAFAKAPWNIHPCRIPPQSWRIIIWDFRDCKQGGGGNIQPGKNPGPFWLEPWRPIPGKQGIRVPGLCRGDDGAPCKLLLLAWPCDPWAHGLPVRQDHLPVGGI